MNLNYNPVCFSFLSNIWTKQTEFSKHIYSYLILSLFMSFTFANGLPVLMLGLIR